MSVESNSDYNHVILNKAKETFTGTIPFKVYSLTSDNIIGMTEHTHDYIQIWYVMGGCCRHWVNNRSYTLTRGNMFVLPPFVNHNIQVVTKEDVSIIGCEFTASFINENISCHGDSNSLFDFTYLEPFLVSSELVRPRLHISGATQEKVEKLLLDMLKEYQNKEKYYQIHIKADVLKLLAIVAREYETQGNAENHELFEKFRDAINSSVNYINENYTNRIYIEDVCKIAMMSQTYFSHLFKQITGKTFIEYINNLRVRKAVEMLINNNNSISDICFAVGFNDTTYFNKVFKKETGLTPGQYRKLSSFC